MIKSIVSYVHENEIGLLFLGRHNLTVVVFTDRLFWL